MVRWTRRAASAVLAVTTSLALTAPLATAAPVSNVGSSAAGPATSATTAEAAQVAAGWLARQLVDGQRIEVTFDFGDGPQTFADQGLTADVVLALAGAGVAASHIDAATDWLEVEVEAYTGSGVGDAYVGPTAKLLLVAAATARTPGAFGGTDLVTLLEDRERPDGRFTDRSDFGDFSSGISQSLAILGLHRTDGTTPSDTAIDYLVEQACSDGGFPQELDATSCVSDVDTTAFAVQALLAVGRTAAASDAVAWLLAQQEADGGFAGAEAGPNANSTGLAATALQVAGEQGATTDARAFLRTLQDDCAAPDPGAIRYDAADSGDPVRATAQAVLGLTDVGLAAVSAAGASSAVPAFDCPFRFPDVDYASPHARAIDDLARRGIMGGRVDGTFAPAAALTRGQLASIVARAAGLPPASGERFSDVAGTTHEGAIHALAERNILQGYADGSFQPGRPVQRDQAAAILARWLELAPVGTDAFGDLAGNTHRQAINALAGIAVARGTADGRYLPGHDIRRDQAASLVARALHWSEAGEAAR